MKFTSAPTPPINLLEKTCIHNNKTSSNRLIQIFVKDTKLNNSEEIYPYSKINLITTLQFMICRPQHAHAITGNYSQ